MNLDLRHPYIRSIFSLVATGDWYTVLTDKELSLKDRLGMALRFLDDEEVCIFTCPDMSA